MKSFLKYTISIILFLFSILELFSGSALSAVLLVIAGLIILPPITAKYKSTFPIIQSRKFRIIVPICLFIFAVGNSPIEANQKKTEANKSTEQTTVKIKDRKDETVVIDSDGSIIEKLDTKKDDKHSIDNLSWKEVNNIKELLGDWSQVCWYPNGKSGNATFTDEKDEEQFKLILTSNSYQSSYPNGLGENPLFKYSWINETGIVKLSNTVIKTHTAQLDNSGKYLKLIFSDNITRILEKGRINNESLSQSNQKAYTTIEKPYDIRFKEFESNCINPWNGEHIKLVELVELNLNDPSSFEHVETRAKLFKNHAIIIMNYRAKNSFGALVLSKLSAKTALETCEVLEIIE